jgi:hypothetical protein
MGGYLKVNSNKKRSTELDSKNKITHEMVLIGFFIIECS